MAVLLCFQVHSFEKFGNVLGNCTARRPARPSTVKHPPSYTGRCTRTRDLCRQRAPKEGKPDRVVDRHTLPPMIPGETDASAASSQGSIL